MLTLPENWTHCNGKENPAGTRGVCIHTLGEDMLWWKGPTWLHNSLEEDGTKALKPSVLEINRDEGIVVHSQQTTNAPSSQSVLMELNHFSKLNRALRVTAWKMRFTHNAKTPEDQRTRPLCTEKIQRAERYWLQSSQREGFEKEIQCLRNETELDKN